MLPPSPGLLPSFVTHPSVPPDPCVYRRAPGELTGSPLVKIQSKLGKLRSFGPCDITTGRGTRFMDASVSVTDAILKDAAVQFGCFPPDNCWQRLPAMWKLEFVALLRLWCTDLLTAAPSADSRRSQVTARLTLPVRPTCDAGRAGPGSLARARPGSGGGTVMFMCHWHGTLVATAGRGCPRLPGDRGSDAAFPAR